MKELESTRLGLSKREILPPIEGAIPVVRIFPLTAMKIRDFRERLLEDPYLEHTDLLRVVLAEKSDASVPSPHMVTALGGKINKGESVGAAAVRKLASETLLYTSHAPTAVLQDDHKDCYFARIPHPDKRYEQPRETYVMAFRVSGASFLLDEPRDETIGGQDRLDRLLFVTKDEFRTMRNTGYFQDEERRIPVIEYLRQGETTAAMGQKQSDTRDRLLESVDTQIIEEERRFRDQMVSEINHIRQGRSFVCKEPYTKAITLRDCTKEEIETAFLVTQMRDMFPAKAGSPESAKRAEALDLLKYARIIAEADPKQTFDMLFSIPSHNTYRAVRAFTGALFDTTGAVFSDEYKINAPSQWYEKLEQVWHLLMTLPIPERAQMMHTWNDLFVEELAGRFHVSKEDIQRGYRLAHEFDEYVTDSMQALGPQFQQHRPMNEVTNALPLTLTLLALGLPMDIHPQNVPLHTDSVRMLRFEAFRTLATLPIALQALEIQKSTDATMIESLLTTFLQFPPVEKLVHLNGSIFHRAVERKTYEPLYEGHPIRFMIDERAMKDTLSVMRKLMLTNQITDIFSINLVISGEQEVAMDNPFVAFSMTKNAITAFETHCKKELEPYGWGIEFVPTSNSPLASEEKVRKYVTAPPEERESIIESFKKGKYPGSIGDLIVRQKYIVTISGPGGEQYKYELCFYPYQRVGAVPQLQGSGFMGFEEKLEDDTKKRYVAQRLIGRDPIHPEQPSAYEVRYPPEIYDHLKTDMKRHQIPER